MMFLVQQTELVLNLDLKTVIIGIVAIVVLLVAGKELILKLCDLYGIESKSKRELKEKFAKIDNIEERLVILEADKIDKDNFRSEVNTSLVNVNNTLSKMNENLEKQNEKLDKSNKTTLEITADRLSQRLRYYLQIQHIPEDELDSLNELYQSWIALGGENHGIEPKYNYVIQNLPIEQTPGFYVVKK